MLHLVYVSCYIPYSFKLIDQNAHNYSTPLFPTLSSIHSPLLIRPQSPVRSSDISGNTLVLGECLLE
jgi:hypothetical protein